MKRWQPQKIIVENEVADNPYTKKILAKFPRAKTRYQDRAKLRLKNDQSDTLLIAKQRGSFVKKCPGTPIYNCCDYYVLNLGIGCFYNCAYCYLHYYMNSPYKVYVNLDDLIREVKDFAAARPDKIIRLGSGEFIDSIGFEEIINTNEILVPELSKIKNLRLEVKTKSADVGRLLELKHQGRVVVSWSVNALKVAAAEEAEAAPVEQRLEAARRCQAAGYKIGFHFDPLIFHPGWESGYREVVDSIFRTIKPENIAWLSLGALRFNSDLKPIIQRKFPDSKIVYEEMLPGLDGKLRYFITIRQRMFSALLDYIRAYADDVPVYLCMENNDLAREVGATPAFSLQD